MAFNPLTILCPVCGVACLSIDLDKVREALAAAKVAPPGALMLFEMPGALLSRTVSKIAGERLGVRCPKCSGVSLSGGSNGSAQDGGEGAGEGQGDELDAEALGFELGREVGRKLAGDGKRRRSSD